MSDLEITAAVRPILAAGRALVLIEEILDSGNYTSADLVRVRSMLARTAARIMGAGKAWIRTPGMGGAGLVHLWGRFMFVNGRSEFSSACQGGGRGIASYSPCRLVESHRHMLSVQHRGDPAATARGLEWDPH